MKEIIVYTIPINIDGKTVDVNPYAISFPYGSVVNDLGEKVWDTASCAKKYFEDKEIIESDGWLAHRWIQYGYCSLMIVSVIALCGSFVFAYIFYMPVIAFAASFSPLVLVPFFGYIATSSLSAQESLQSFPETKKHMVSAILDNIAFLKKDHSKLNSKIRERIRNIDVVINDMGRSCAHEFINKKNRYLELQAHIKVAQKHLLDIGIL